MRDKYKYVSLMIKWDMRFSIADLYNMLSRLPGVADYQETLVSSSKRPKKRDRS